MSAACTAPDAGSAPVFTPETPEALDAAAVEAEVAASGFAVVRGLFSPDEMAGVKRAFAEALPRGVDAPGVGTPADAAQRVFRKIVIGGGSQRGYYIPRFVRVAYAPIWAEDVFTARDAFRRLARVRNRLQGYAPDYAVEGLTDGFFTGARIQHYPAGGGFFASHRDAVIDTVTREAGLRQFFQLVLLVTQKGVDFEEGGAFVTSHGTRLDLEAVAGAGDVLVYDGRSEHGVDDVDPHRTPDLASPAGRLVMLASLYTDMTNGAAYARYLARDYP